MLSLQMDRTALLSRDLVILVLLVRFSPASVRQQHVASWLVEPSGSNRSCPFGPPVRWRAFFYFGLAINLLSF